MKWKKSLFFILFFFCYLSFLPHPFCFAQSQAKTSSIKKENELKTKVKPSRKKKTSSKSSKKQKNLTKQGIIPEPQIPQGNLEAIIETTMGVIKIDLFKEKNPIAVENFVHYATTGFYNNTIFHRIIDGFIVQAGAYDAQFNEKINQTPPIPDTSENGIKNTVGTIAVARKPSDPRSGTSQFFINLADNTYLDAQPHKPGYAVFGKVIVGLDVVKKIARVKIGQREWMYNIPFYPEQVMIKRILIRDPPVIQEK